MDPGAVGDIIIDAHWKRIGLLKHHSHLFTQQGGIYLRIIDIFIVKKHRSLDLYIGNQIVHTV